jgi:hypothetical protein
MAGRYGPPPRFVLLVDALVYMTVVSLARRPGDRGHQFNTAVATDVIWAFAAPEAKLEHAHVAELGNEVHIVLFFNAQTFSEARSAGLRLCARACHSSPALHDWEVSQ